MDEGVAKKLGCLITDIPILSVAIADGARVNFTSIVKQFSWILQNTGFTLDMLLIPLGCCDVVLGIEWLVTLGDITWNFDRLLMQFYVQGKKLVLRGATGARLKMARKKQLQTTIASGVHLSMLQLCDTDNNFLLHSLTTHATNQATPESIEELLLQFEDIFQEPTRLPPKRKGHDHKIPLVAGANPINNRPYIYAKQQKDVIDKLVQDSLMSGTI